MNYRKPGLRALGLAFLAVLGLMAFAASGAQGSGKVLVLRADGGLLPIPFTVGITGEAEKALEGSRLILGLNMEIFCHATSVTNGSLTSSGHATATLLLETCLAQGVSSGTLSGATCTIPNIVAKVLALIILHSGNTKLTLDGSGGAEHKLPKIGEPYILFTPEDGLTFAKVLNHTECALPEIANVKGCVVAKVSTIGDQVTHLITTKGMLELFGCKLNYGANEAHLNFDALVSLTGVHAGLKWGVE